MALWLYPVFPMVLKMFSFSLLTSFLQTAIIKRMVANVGGCMNWLDRRHAPKSMVHAKMKPGEHGGSAGVACLRGEGTWRVRELAGARGMIPGFMLETVRSQNGCIWIVGAYRQLEERGQSPPPVGGHPARMQGACGFRNARLPWGRSLCGDATCERDPRKKEPVSSHHLLQRGRHVLARKRQERLGILLNVQRKNFCVLAEVFLPGV
jgi:hypothetical protein